MRLPLFIARRYFFARSSSNAVNIITGISVLGIFVGTAALIVVLSAFNGLENLVREFYRSFDPDLKIEQREGRFFHPDSMDPQLLQDDRIASYSWALEEKALFSYRDHQYIATAKGVDPHFPEVTAITEHLESGNYHLQDSLPVVPAVLGAGVAYRLGFNSQHYDQNVRIFVPGSQPQGINMSNTYQERQIRPMGIFSIQPEFDEKYVLLPLSFTRSIYRRAQQVTQLEIRLQDYGQAQAFQEHWRQKLGSSYTIRNREEQQAAFFKVMQTEGLFTFLIFALILAIATFTITGSLTMLMFDKRDNLRTLHAIGMSASSIRSIFFLEGNLISLVGGSLGLVVGTTIIYLQEKFELIRIGSGYVVEAYPVALRSSDLILVTTTVLVLSLTSSYFTSRRLPRESLDYH